MRTLLAVGLVAAVSATAGAQFGGSSWASPMRDVVVLETASQLATPPPALERARARRSANSSVEIDPNPYYAGAESVAFAVRSNPTATSFDVEPNPYFGDASVAMGTTRASVTPTPSVRPAAIPTRAADIEANPYLTTNAPARAPRALVPLESNPYRKVQVEQNPYRL